MSGSKFIPNSFQTPNAYVDQYMAFLTPEEYVVLSYTVRRILGFQLRSSRISITQYEDGLFDDDGRRLDYGTGLSRDAIRKALAALLHFGMILEIAPGEKWRHLGPEYALQLDSELVNFAALRQRFSDWKQRNQKRTGKARDLAAEKRNPTSVGQTSESDVCGTDGATSVGQTSPTSVGQTTMYKEEIQIRKPEENQIHAPHPSGASRNGSEALSEKEKKKADEQAINERHMGIMTGYLAELGYPWDGNREARAAKKLAKLGYTWDRVQRYYRTKKATLEYAQRHLALETIALNIGAWEHAEAQAGGPNHDKAQGNNGHRAGGIGSGGTNGRAALSRNGLAGSAMPDDFVDKEREQRRRLKAAREEPAG